MSTCTLIDIVGTVNIGGVWPQLRCIEDVVWHRKPLFHANGNRDKCAEPPPRCFVMRDDVVTCASIRGPINDGGEFDDLDVRTPSVLAYLSGVDGRFGWPHGGTLQCDDRTCARSGITLGSDGRCSQCRFIGCGRTIVEHGRPTRVVCDVKDGAP